MGEGHAYAAGLKQAGAVLIHFACSPRGLTGSPLWFGCISVAKSPILCKCMPCGGLASYSGCPRSRAWCFLEQASCYQLHWIIGYGKWTLHILIHFSSGFHFPVSQC